MTEQLTSLDPWSGETVFSAPAASAADVGDAAQAAHGVAGVLGAMGWAARGAALARVAAAVRGQRERLAELMVREVGKPVTEAHGEVERTALIFDFFAQEGRRAKGALIDADEPYVSIITRRRPLGPVALITPWNFPLAIPAWKLAPALLSGNPVLWKPSPHSPACAAALMECLTAAGLPDGAVALLFGGAETGRAIVAQELAGVSFTGSTKVGTELRTETAPRGIRTQLEMGGKNVAVVLDDADIPAAATAIARAAFGFAGQKCTATSVVVATAVVREQLTDALAEITAQVPWGDPREETAWGGPVITAEQAARLRSIVAEAEATGAEVLARASTAEHPHVVAPVLLRTTDRQSIVAATELFGPVLTVIERDDAPLDELANATEHGLAASVFGRDASELRSVCDKLAVGVIAINRMSTGLEPQAPVAGWGASGSHEPEQGVEAITFYTRNQTMFWRDAPS